MREVCFLGLSAKDAPRQAVRRLEVWTINDWYLRYPWLERPARIYQTHTLNMRDDETIRRACGNRMLGWREAYERSGAEVVVLRDLDLSRQRIVRPYIETYGLEFYSSTLAYMTQDAMAAEVGRVEIHGVSLDKGSEYVYQLPGILINIDAMRKRGIEVACAKELEWRSNLNTVDWTKIRPLRVPYGCEGSGACYDPNTDPKIKRPPIKIQI